MNVARACAVVLLLVASLCFSACCGSSKEKVIEKESVVVPKEATLGKQLEDLKEAYKKGAITQEEYEAGKRKLLTQ